ncbi:FAD binding domain-containing protein [Apiospora phragmitis]|uniref:FAD binding domain-containing protein n=1 Tax=Apiospora phragmitis TaxID=2905665 RepID=A0ABR1W0Y7_9PEZI
MASTRESVIASIRDAGLGGVLLPPEKPLYSMRIDTYWSLGARLRSWAIVQPRTTDEVSRTVKAIVAVPGAQFAIRSGGHMWWPGASNITEGVTIDLGRMRTTTYDPATRLAAVQPGAKWNDVYPVVEKQGRMVTGGRVGDVGVGGYLTGGGLSFHNCRTGLACDSVVRYEVVLGDGRIVEADKDNNPDLYHALKGGGNNFGVVTRFDLETFEAKTCWGGFAMYSDEAGPALLEAYGDYMHHASKDPSGAFMLFWTYDSARDEVSWMSVLMGLDGDAEAKMYQKTLEVPSNFAQMGSTSIYKIASSIKVPNGKYTAWRTLCFKYDEALVKKTHARSAQLTQAVRDLAPADAKFSLGYVIQPVLKNIGTQSRARALDTMGLGDVPHDSCMFLIMAEFDTPQLHAAAAPHIEVAFGDVEAAAAALDAGTRWLYLNYCDPSQNPLASYGAEAVERLKVVSRKYDPEGVFQKRVPGGFKIFRA